MYDCVADMTGISSFVKFMTYIAVWAISPLTKAQHMDEFVGDGCGWGVGDGCG